MSASGAPSSSSSSPKPARTGGGFAWFRSDDAGKLLLRLSIGGMMLLHGIHKVQHGVEWMRPMLEGKGLPAFMSYGVYITELIAPAMIILGLWTRVGGLILAAGMAMAIYLAHAGDVGKLTDHGGWAVELPMLYALGGLALFFMGGGRWSVTGGRGTWN